MKTLILTLLVGIISAITVVFLAHYGILPIIVGKYAGAVLIVVSVAYIVTIARKL